MDAQRTAEARIELVERRLTALQEAGLDTAGLASRLDLARSALAQGRADEVPAICEDLLADARRLANGGAVATRTSRPVRTDRSERLRPAATESIAPSNAPPVQSALDVRIDPDPVTKEQVTAWLQPQFMGLEGRLEERLNGIAPLVESLKAQVAAQAVIDTASIERIIEQAVSPLLESLQTEIAERFARLSAKETTIIPRPGVDEAQVQTLVEGVRQEVENRITDLAGMLPAPGAEDRLLKALDERLSGLAEDLRTEVESRLAGMSAALPTPASDARMADFLDRRLEARLAAVTEHTAMAIESLRTEVHDRAPTTPTTVRVQQALAGAMPEATALAVEQALAPLESRLDTRLTEMAETVGSLEAQIHDFHDTASQISRLDTRIEDLHEHLDQRIEAVVGERLTTVITDSLKALDASVAATVRELVGEALAGRPKSDHQETRTQIANELRADLDFQLEQMAAEKGWVSINDVRAEVAQQRRGDGGALQAAPANQPGFARLEAALVEFVRQTQSQQENFLSVLKTKVEHHTEVLAERAITGAISRQPDLASPSSEAISIPHRQEALDPLDANDALPGTSSDLPEIAHSTLMLNALARGQITNPGPEDLSATNAEAIDTAQDPDLPPSDDLDPLSLSVQTRTLRDSQAAIPAMTEHHVDLAQAIEDAVRDEEVLGDDPCVSEVDGPTVRTEAFVPTTSVVDPDIAAEIPPVTNTDDSITAIHSSPSVEEIDLSSEVMELDPVSPPPHVVLGLDDKETTTFEAAETRTHSGMTDGLHALPPDLLQEASITPEDVQENEALAAGIEAALAAAEPVAEATLPIDPPEPAMTEIDPITDFAEPPPEVTEAIMPAAEAEVVAQAEPEVVAQAEPEVVAQAEPEVVAQAEPEPEAVAEAEPTTAEAMTGPLTVDPITTTQATAPTVPMTAPVTPPTTRRSVTDIEAALRGLISQELERQLGAGLPNLTAAVRNAVAEAMDRHRQDEADHLAATIRTTVQQELEQQSPDPAKDLAALAQALRSQTARAPAPTDLRETMVTLLQDPLIRQTVLEIVAVEAIANPGPLAELTGLRAFIRREVRQAGNDHGEDLPQEVLSET